MAKQLYGVDYVEGKWSINYDKMHMSAAFGGKEQTFDFEIIGDKLWYRNPNLKGGLGEVKRFR